MRNRLLIILLILAYLFQGTLVEQVGSQGVAAFAGLTIGQILNRLEESVNNIIRLAGAEAQLTVMEVGQAAISAIGALRAAYADSLDRTLKGLTDQQRQAFEKVQFLIEDANNKASARASDLAKLTADINAAASNLPFGKRTPYLKGTVDPKYFVVQPGGSLRLRLEGQNLGGSTPYLRLKDDNRVIEATSYSDTEAMFVVPQPDTASYNQALKAYGNIPKTFLESSASIADLLNDIRFELSENISQASALIELGATKKMTGDIISKKLPLPEIMPTMLEAEVSFYELKGGFFGLFSKRVPRYYRIALFPVPPVIGNYGIDVKRTVRVEESKDRKSPGFRCESPNGHGSSTVPVHIVASEGWQIDTATIGFNADYNNHGNQTFQSVAPSGFTAQLTCDGFGRVEGPFGVVIDHGSRGVIQGSFKYVERKSGDQDVITTVKSGLLKWGDSVAVPNLPRDTKTVIVNLSTYTGKSIVMQGQSNGKFLVADYNAAAQTLVLTAREPNEALTKK